VIYTYWLLQPIGQTMNDNKTGRFINQFEDLLTKEVLEKAYAELGTLKSVGQKFGLSGDCIKKYMILHGLQYQEKIVYHCNDAFFELDNENSFYWAGFFAADGNVSKENDINLGLSSKDIIHLEKFKLATNATAPIISQTIKANIIDGVKVKEDKSFSLIRFRSHKMSNDLIRFNVIPNKTKIYDLPDWMISHPLIHHFIRGYFDGDGWFSIKSKNKWNKQYLSWGICGNFSFLSKIKEIIISSCQLNSDPQIYKQKNIFRLNFSSQRDVLKIVNWL
jgi:hypothetical protein